MVLKRVKKNSPLQFFSCSCSVQNAPLAAQLSGPLLFVSMSPLNNTYTQMYKCAVHECICIPVCVWSACGKGESENGWARTCACLFWRWILHDSCAKSGPGMQQNSPFHSTYTLPTRDTDKLQRSVASPPTTTSRVFWKDRGGNQHFTSRYLDNEIYVASVINSTS